MSESILDALTALHEVLKDAALARKSQFAEPLINVMLTDKKKIHLTIYAPSTPLTENKRNHEYEFDTAAALIAKLPELISVAKSTAYRKNA